MGIAQKLRDAAKNPAAWDVPGLLTDAADLIDPGFPTDGEGRERTLRVYHIQFDGEQYVVEAMSVAMAVKAWKKHVKEEWQEDFDNTEEPESITLINDKPVIR